MRKSIKNLVPLVLLVMVVAAGTFVLQETELVVFGGISILTILLMVSLPKLACEALQQHVQFRFDQKEDLKGWKEENRKKSMQYSTMIIDSFEKLLFWTILIGGLAAAFQFSGMDIGEIEYGEFKLTVLVILRFFWIMSFVVFMSRVVPLFLIKVLHNFIHQLSTIGGRENKARAEGEVEEKKEEGNRSGGKEGSGPEEEKITGRGEPVGAGSSWEEGIQKSGSTGEPPEERPLVSAADPAQYQGHKDTRTGKVGSEGGEKEKERPSDIEVLIHSFFTYTILVVGLAYAIATLGFRLDTELDLPGLRITVQELLNAALAAVITSVFIVYFYPAFLNILITSIIRLFSRHYEDEEERLALLRSEVEKIEPGMKRTLLYLILLSGSYITLSFLRHDSIESLISLLQVILRALIVLAAAFLLTTLTPIFVYTLSATGEDIKKSHLYQAGKYVNYLILLLALFIVMNVLGMSVGEPINFGQTSITMWGIITAVVIIVVSLMLSKMIIAMLRDTILTPDQIDVHASVVLEKVIHITIVFIGVMIAMGTMGLNLVALITGLGLIGFALAFGMQDTIANLMAGIMIAVEKPFKIGDRIRVGDEWGDVLDIGLRSTKIRTTTHEIVVVPNNVIATGEIWNYTKDSSKLILTIPFGIGYGSDWHLAEKIILDVGSKHPEAIEGTPPTKVRMIQYGDSSIDLQLRLWIANARQKEDVRSDILKEVKDRFDVEGIEIPFPVRTIVFKNTPPKENGVEEILPSPRPEGTTEEP